RPVDGAPQLCLRRWIFALRSSHPGYRRKLLRNTIFGGASAYGTVYKMTPTGALTVLHSFDLTNGSAPYGPLVQGNDGSFYGTTYGGVSGTRYGTVFRVTGNGTFTMLHAFNLTDGANPYAGLVLGKDGNFFGVSFSG